MRLKSVASAAKKGGLHQTPVEMPCRGQSDYADDARVRAVSRLWQVWLFGSLFRFVVIGLWQPPVG